jgi:hypothetical protein
MEMSVRRPGLAPFGVFGGCKPHREELPADGHYCQWFNW